MNDMRYPARVSKKNTSYKILIPYSPLSVRAHITEVSQNESNGSPSVKINNGSSSFRSEMLGSISPFGNILRTCFKHTEPKIKGLNQTQLQRNSLYRTTSKAYMSCFCMRGKEINKNSV